MALVKGVHVSFGTNGLGVFSTFEYILNFVNVFTHLKYK